MEQQEKTNSEENAAPTGKKSRWKMILAFVIIMSIGYGVGFGVGRLLKLADQQTEQPQVEQTETVDTTTDTAE